MHSPIATQDPVVRRRSIRSHARITAAITAAALTLAVGAARPVAARPAADDYGVTRFKVTNLASDQPGQAPVTDPNLKNAWGLSLGPTSGLWVSANETDNALIYTGGVNGKPFAPASLVVSIPGGAPTGQIFNPTTDFVVTNGTDSAPALFIFAAESGQITGWNPKVAPATTAKPLASTPGAIYKGIAMVSTSYGNELLATDFHNTKVDIFDSAGKPVTRRGAFVDPFIPKGYAPFGIKTVGDKVVVTYAQQDADREDDVAGPGKGFVDVYTDEGRLVRRLVSRGPLNAPWGLEVAPHTGFGRFNDALLIGNFGDGAINAFTLSGVPLGALRDTYGKPVKIEGLWGLQLGNGTAGTPQTLFFAAGPDDEEHGLLGSITVAPSSGY